MSQQLKKETLIKGTVVYTNNVHKFGADAIFLAHFAAVKRLEKVCDFGTGCGIIPLRLFDRGHRGICVGVDIDESAVNLLAKSTDENSAQNILPLCVDIRSLIPKRFSENFTNSQIADVEDIKKNKESDNIISLKHTALQNTQFDVITCNPPYFTGGFISPNKAKGNARHEQTLTTAQVCRSAAPLLKDGAKLCLCQRPERLADVICAMREVNIEPKRLQFVTVSEKKQPWLFLIEGQKNRAVGLKVLPPLITENSDGTRPSAAVKQIYEL